MQGTGTPEEIGMAEATGIETSTASTGETKTGNANAKDNAEEEKNNALEAEVATRKTKTKSSDFLTTSRASKFCLNSPITTAIIL